jgi:hypothetical protein
MPVKSGLRVLYSGSGQISTDKKTPRRPAYRISFSIYEVFYVSNCYKVVAKSLSRLFLEQRRACTQKAKAYYHVNNPADSKDFHVSDIGFSQTKRCPLTGKCKIFRVIRL